jgi:hypothetical protein
VAGQRLRLPKTAALKHGGKYDWRVSTDDGRALPIAGNGSFQVVDAPTARRVAAARPKPGAAFSERLLFAAMLETEGLANEAQRAWRELAKERPDDAGLRQWAERQ